MLQLKGKYCKDCKIFTDNIEQSALSMMYHFLDNPMFNGSKIRFMPDAHAYKDSKEILNLIRDTVDVECLIKPIINLKASK